MLQETPGAFNILDYVWLSRCRLQDSISGLFAKRLLKQKPDLAQFTFEQFSCYMELL